MPYVNRQGQIAHGVAGSGAYLNNALFDTGGGCGWVDQHTIAYQHGGADGWFVMLYDIVTQQFVRGITDTSSPFYGIGVNAIFSGGGVWAGWTNIPGIGLFSSTGFHKPAAGLMGVGLGGEIAFVENYQAGGPTIVHERDGHEWVLSHDVVYDLRLLGNRRAVWQDPHNQIHVAGLPQPMQLGPAWSPRAVDIHGQWWVLYFCAQGVVLHPFDSFMGYVIVPPGQDAWTDMSGLDGRPDVIRVVWSITPGEIAGHLMATDVDTVGDARVNLVPDLVPDPMPVIGRPLWLGWFEFLQPPTFAPGNAWLNVFWTGGTGVISRTHDGVPFAQWVQGGTVEEIELKAGGASRPAVAYWDGRRWPRYPVLPDNSWLALLAYRRADETPAQCEADMRREIQRASIAGYKRIALVCQCYTSNLSLTSDLAGNVPVYARLARDFPQVTMLLVFSNQGRATGLNDHPEVLSLWKALAAGIPSAPLDTTPDPEPEDPMPSGPTLHDWTILEFPQTVEARRTHLNDQTWQPDPAWVILQMARRYGFGLPPGEAPWSLQKMINHELNPEGH